MAQNRKLLQIGTVFIAEGNFLSLPYKFFYQIAVSATKQQLTAIHDCQFYLPKQQLLKPFNNRYYLSYFQ